MITKIVCKRKRQKKGYLPGVREGCTPSRMRNKNEGAVQGVCVFMPNGIGGRRARTCLSPALTFSYKPLQQKIISTFSLNYYPVIRIERNEEAWRATLNAQWLKRRSCSPLGSTAPDLWTASHRKKDKRSVATGDAMVSCGWCQT